jgi:glycosyltransferase involved in cell wall biosynthesis
MRIVYLLTSLGIGGAERQALDLTERLRERGHIVAVFTLRPQLDEEWPTSLPVFRMGMKKDPVSVCAAAIRARRTLRDLSPDVIHSHGFHANLFARLLGMFVPGAAIVSTIHNVYEGGRLRMLAYRLSDRLSARTTAVSEAVAQRFVALRAVRQQRCTVVRNAIDIDELVPEPARRAKMRQELGAGADFIWLAAGRIAPAKDYPNLLRAFSRLRPAHPGAQLWIAGQGTESAVAELENLAKELGIERCTRFLGLRRDLAALLDAADAFVLSSAWEGMPLAAAEAMAMEKCVVATDVGGVRELAGDCARLVFAKNPGALAEAMDAVMREPEGARRARGQAARARVAAHFSVEARVEEWEEIYRAVMRSKAWPGGGAGRPDSSGNL